MTLLKLFCSQQYLSNLKLKYFVVIPQHQSLHTFPLSKQLIICVYNISFLSRSLSCLYFISSGSKLSLHVSILAYNCSVSPASAWFPATMCRSCSLLTYLMYISSLLISSLQKFCKNIKRKNTFIYCKIWNKQKHLMWYQYLSVRGHHSKFLVKNGHNSKILAFRVMPLVLQLCLVKMSKYSKFGVDTFNTLSNRLYLFFWHDNDNNDNLVIKIA